MTQNSQTKEKSSKSRIRSLDCIRFVAILLVYGFHVAHEFEPSELDPIARFFMKYGFLGVDVFFPLSGYLITGFILSERKESNARTFFLRRLFRIVPLYLVAVTTFYFSAKIMGIGEEQLRSIWLVYLFLTGWSIFFSGVESVPYRITWSLSVEEFAYLFIGLFGYFCRRHFLGFLVFGALSALLLRAVCVYLDWDDSFYLPPARFDSIAVGALLAIGLKTEEWRTRTQSATLILTIAMISACFVSLFLFKLLLFLVVAMISCSLIVVCDRFEGGFQSKPAEFIASIGFYSYFLYLFQYFNIEGLCFLFRKLGWEGWLGFWSLLGMSFALTLVQAMISYRYFEAPLIRLGRRLEGISDSTVQGSNREMEKLT